MAETLAYIPPPKDLSHTQTLEFQTEGYIMEANGVIQQFDEVIAAARETHELNGNTSQFRDLLVSQVFNPISQDEHVSRSALGFISHSAQDPTLLKDLNDIREERAQQLNPARTLPEVIMAITHAVNYIKVFHEGKDDYVNQDGLYTYKDWSRVYEHIATSEEREIYRQLLLTKEIVTTDPMRAVGVHAVANMVFNGELLNWLDMGPSNNSALARISNETAAAWDSYKMIDNTTYKGKRGLIVPAAQKLVNVGIGMGMDKSNPYKDKNWYLACGLPADMNPVKLEEKRKKMDEYGKIKNVILLPGQDMRDPQVESKWNIVSALTSAYLIPNGEGQRDEMFRKWEELLTDDDRNFIAVQDYLYVGEDGNLTLVDTRKEGEYALAIKGKLTDNQWKVLLRYKDSHCSEIANGEHFEEFMNRLHPGNNNGKHDFL